jgi:hypothetical protein
MFSLPIPYVDSATEALVEKTGIKRLKTETVFEDYGLETISFAYVGAMKALPVVGSVAALACVIGVGKVTTLIFPKIKLFGVVYKFVSHLAFFNLPIRYLQESSVDLFISSTMSIRTGFFGSPNKRELGSIIEVSGIVSIIFLAMIGIYMVYIIFYLI